MADQPSVDLLPPSVGGLSIASNWRLSAAALGYANRIVVDNLIPKLPARGRCG